MKAPDVIYANDYGIWYKKEPPVRETEKFIRKDALLEWAKMKLENSVGQYQVDYDLALLDLIGKLNSM